MKRVAPELESLMWTLAEEGNDRAIDEFGARHPELRSELLRRMAMVKGLRGEKKRTTEPVKTIPRFVPKEQKTSSHFYVVGALVLAALFALTFAVTTLMTPPTHGHKTDYVPPVDSHTEVNRSLPNEIQSPSNTPKSGIEQPRIQEPPVEQLKPGTLRLNHAPLLTVLEMISQTCGVRIEPAPGMPNPNVDVDYREMNAMEMLRSLGRQYAFTPLDQHDGSILVVPAIDPNDQSMQNPDSGGMRDRKVGG